MQDGTILLHSSEERRVNVKNAAGVPKEDRVYSHMLKFLQSVQNRTESNPGGYKLEDGTILSVGEDGGAYYKPTESKAGWPVCVLEFSEKTCQNANQQRRMRRSHIGGQIS